jgi:ferredoxin
MAPISITVNNKAHTVEVAPDAPLLWVLRDTLGFTGTKFGCGQSLCGACTVHVDGEPARSCITPNFPRSAPAKSPPSKAFPRAASIPSSAPGLQRKFRNAAIARPE